jgi:hypothetical protein
MKLRRILLPPLCVISLALSIGNVILINTVLYKQDYGTCLITPDIKSSPTCVLFIVGNMVTFLLGGILGGIQTYGEITRREIRGIVFTLVLLQMLVSGGAGTYLTFKSFLKDMGAIPREEFRLVLFITTWCITGITLLSSIIFKDCHLIKLEKSEDATLET